MDQTIRLRHQIEGEEGVRRLQGQYAAAREEVEKLYKSMGSGPAFNVAAQPYLETMVRLTGEIREQQKSLGQLEHGWLGAVGGMQKFAYLLDDLQYVNQMGIRPILNNIMMFSPHLAIAGIVADQVYRNWDVLTSRLRDSTGNLDLSLGNVREKLGEIFAGMPARTTSPTELGLEATGKRLEQLKKQGDDLTAADRMERDFLERRKGQLERSTKDLDELRDKLTTGQAAVGPMLEETLMEGGGREAIERVRAQRKLRSGNASEAAEFQKQRDEINKKLDEIKAGEEKVANESMLEYTLYSLTGAEALAYAYRKAMTQHYMGLQDKLDKTAAKVIDDRFKEIDRQIDQILQNIRSGPTSAQPANIEALRKLFVEAGMAPEHAAAEAAAMAARARITPEQQAAYRMETTLGGGTPAAAIEFARQRANQLEAEYARLMQETGGQGGTQQARDLQDRVNQANQIYQRLNEQLGGLAQIYSENADVLAQNKEKAQTLARMFEEYTTAITRGEAGEAELNRLREEANRVLRENLADRVAEHEAAVEDRETVRRIREDQERESRAKERDIAGLHLGEQVRQGVSDEEMIAELRHRGYADEFARKTVADARAADEERRDREREVRREHGLTQAAQAVLPHARALGLGAAMEQAERAGEASEATDARLAAQMAARYRLQPEAARRAVAATRDEFQAYQAQQRAMEEALGPLATVRGQMQAARAGRLGPEFRAMAAATDAQAAATEGLNDTYGQFFAATGNKDMASIAALQALATNQVQAASIQQMMASRFEAIRAAQFSLQQQLQGIAKSYQMSNGRR